MRTIQEFIDLSNEWLVSKGYPQLNSDEIVMLCREGAKVVEMTDMPQFHNIDMMEALLAMYICKAVCEFRGIEVPEVVEGSKLMNPQNFKYCFATKEFIDV